MQPQTKRIAQLGAALVVMHSPVDGTVAVDNARVIFEAARHAKSFVAIDGANHLLTDRNAAAYVAGIIPQYAGRSVQYPDWSPGCWCAPAQTVDRRRANATPSPPSNSTPARIAPPLRSLSPVAASVGPPGVPRPRAAGSVTVTPPR